MLDTTGTETREINPALTAAHVQANGSDSKAKLLLLEALRAIDPNSDLGLFCETLIKIDAHETAYVTGGEREDDFDAYEEAVSALGVHADALVSHNDGELTIYQQQRLERGLT